MFFRHVFCGDYIFSGHTMTLVRFNFFMSDRYSPAIMTILAHLETIQCIAMMMVLMTMTIPMKTSQVLAHLVTWDHNLHHVSHQNLQGSGPPGDNPLLSPLLAPPPLALTGSCSVRGRPALAVQRALLYWSVFLQIFFFFGIILSVSIPAQAHLCHHLDHHLGLYSIILKRSAGILL